MRWTVCWHWHVKTPLTTLPQQTTVARMIAGRSVLSNKRQIFFVQIGGWDTHESQGGAEGEFATNLNDLGVESLPRAARGLRLGPNGSGRPAEKVELFGLQRLHAQRLQHLDVGFGDAAEHAHQPIQLAGQGCHSFRQSGGRHPAEDG